MNVGPWATMEMRHLLALRAIADSGSFHEAAARLGYTQSAISQQVAALEQLIGDQLIARPGGSRPVRLTPSGELLLQHAHEVFRQLGAARADLDALRTGDAVRLRVGAFQSVGATIVPALMDRLARRPRALQIDFTHAISDDELFDRLESHKLDMTFAMLPVPDGPFSFLQLFAEPFVALAAASSPLARGRNAVTLTELASQPLITARECRYSAHLIKLLRERGLNARVAHRSDDNGTVAGLVAAGAGVALVPRLVADGAGPGVRTVEVEEHLPARRVGLAWHQDRLAPSMRDAFAEEAAQVCAELRLRS